MHTPLLTSYAQGRPPCHAETRDAQYVEQPGYDPLTAATMQCHYHHNRGTPSASPTTIIDLGQPQHHAEARNTKFARRSGHDPPTAVTMRDDDDCNRGPPIAPSTPTVDQTQGPRCCAQACGVDHQMPVCRDPPTTTTTIEAHQQHPPPTTAANGRKPQRCTEACDAEFQEMPLDPWMDHEMNSRKFMDEPTIYSEGFLVQQVKAHP